MLRRLALNAAVLTSIGMAACGGGGDEERSIEDSVYALYDAFAAKDARKACAALTAGARRAVARPGRSCERTLSATLEASGERVTETSEIQVTDVAVDGDTAEASVVLRGVRTRIGLAKASGDWKVERLPGGAG